MDIQRNEDVRKEHVYNAPSAIDTREYVPHDKRGIPKALTNQAADEEHYRTNDEGLQIVFYGILPAFVVTFCADRSIILGSAFGTEPLSAIWALRNGWPARMIVTIHIVLLHGHVLVETNLQNKSIISTNNFPKWWK